MSTNRSDIDIDDPNFWQKWAKKAELDVDELTNKVTAVAKYLMKLRQDHCYLSLPILFAKYTEY